MVADFRGKVNLNGLIQKSRVIFFFTIPEQISAYSKSTNFGGYANNQKPFTSARGLCKGPGLIKNSLTSFFISYRCLSL